MARVDPNEYAEKWGRRLKSATEDVRRGISRVSTAPGLDAVKQQDKLVSNFQESVSSGRWASATRAVSLADWQRAASEKGVNRIAAGVDAALPQQAAMAQRLLAATDAAVAKVKALSSTTLDDNINRMVTFSREMAKSKGRIKTG
jgi:hypothetical protein